MDAQSRTLPDLISDLTSDVTTLIRKESELVRTEVSEKISQGGKAAGLASFGAALLLGGFLILLQAAVLALSKVLDPVWASIIVGGVVAALGFVVVRSAVEKLKPKSLQPDRAVRQLQKDARMLKEQV
jgi:uncharacterized membrane protein YjfL (UPF0719 family)